MTNAELTHPPTAYLLRIELQDVQPAVIREVLVDPGITLRALHKVIQAAMGWQTSHLHAFALPERATDSFWEVPKTRQWQEPDPDGWGEPTGNDAKITLGELLTAPQQQLLYVYDFGDDWQHTITLLAIKKADAPLPHLVAAQTGCPPEDCGGLPGLEYWTGAWHDTRHESHDIARLMFGEFGPGYLDVAALHAALFKLRKKPRLSKR